MGQRASNCGRPGGCAAEESQPPAAPTATQGKAQGQVQQAFASQADWESVFENLKQNPVVSAAYGEFLETLHPDAQKVLQVRTLAPMAAAAYAKKPEALSAKRKGILNTYRDVAEKKGVPWRADAQTLEDRGLATWEKERAAAARKVHLPEYYAACYHGPIHSYDRGNGEWMAAFDAPSAYLLVHLHHYPDLTPQAAFDKLHEEFDMLALGHLATPPGCPVRVVDIGCGVGTSTFSTARSLQCAGRTAKVTGVDLSDYFITVARHLQPLHVHEGVELDFMHGDGLDLANCGFGEASLEMVVVSEVTHEMPKACSEALFVEAARVLVPGGVLGYMDLNPAQILKENLVGSLVDRVATSNEPYFDQYLELDVPAAMRAAGLEVLEQTWPNHGKYPTLESCSLRFIVARKPVELSPDTWTGHWALDRRENWGQYLTFLGVPEAAHEMATKAPDFHEYTCCDTSFFMDHRIPAQNLHLRYTGFLDDEWQESPYPVPTAALFNKDGTPEAKKRPQFKHRWIQKPTCFETILPNFAGKDKTISLRRELVGPDEIKYTVHVHEPDTHETLLGPFYAWMKRTSSEPPMSVAKELKDKFSQGDSAKLEWRLEAIQRAADIVLENVEAFSAAQEADHISPSSLQGVAIMMKSAAAFYKANLPTWMEAQTPAETLPPFLQTEGTWEVVPQPKGVGLVIAPWNAPAILAVLPTMAMLAAGNLCVIKPSEAAPTVSRLLGRLVPQYFPDRSVVVVEGGKDAVEGLIQTPVDHILFTGGGLVGKRICELAARHLTPVSLELGGKNPCFVDEASPAELEVYAAEIVGTKKYFGGQFCQAQDYCLVSESVFEAFVGVLEAKIQALGESRSCRMVNKTHAARVRALLAGQEALARPPLPQENGQQEDDTVPLTVIVAPSLDSPVMQEEIFGPLLPVIKVSGVDEAVQMVRKRPKPLVAYCYSTNEAAYTAFRDCTGSGNLAVNCGPQRMQSNMNVGFGGAGESGYGYSIWGKAAFDDFSHHKAIFRGTAFAGSSWGAARPPSS